MPSLFAWEIIKYFPSSSWEWQIISFLDLYGGSISALEENRTTGIFYWLCYSSANLLRNAHSCICVDTVCRGLPSTLAKLCLQRYTPHTGCYGWYSLSLFSSYFKWSALLHNIHKTRQWGVQRCSHNASGDRDNSSSKYRHSAQPLWPSRKMCASPWKKKILHLIRKCCRTPPLTGEFLDCLKQNNMKEVACYHPYKRIRNWWFQMTWKPVWDGWGERRDIPEETGVDSWRVPPVKTARNPAP